MRPQSIDADVVLTEQRLEFRKLVLQTLETLRSF